MKVGLAFCRFALLLAIASVSQYARAQPDPRHILAGMIQQVQTGTPNPSWYGLQLWQAIAVQTGNTGVYPQLVRLGPVQNIAITQQMELPQGWLFGMSVQHSQGQSSWIFGISRYSNRIEYANFNIGQSLPPPQLPAPTPGPARPTDDASEPSPRSEPSDSEACRKFPNLC